MSVAEIEKKVYEDLQKMGTNNEEHNGEVSKETNEKSGQIFKEEGMLTDFEKEQQKKGWNPGGRKTAEEWAENEPIAVELRAIRAENKKYQETVDNLKSYLSKQEEIGYQRALNDLAEQRADAIRRGDVREVNRLDEEQANLASIAPLPVNAPPHPAITDFYDRNKKWIDGTSVTEIEMMAFATARDQVIAKKNLPPEHHMKLLEECIVTQFPNYFGAGKSEVEYINSPTVESATKSTTSQFREKKYTRASLSAEQKAVLKGFEDFKIMDEATYIAGLINSGDLK